MIQPDSGVKDLPVYLDLVSKKLRSLAPDNIGGLDRLLARGGKRWRPSLVIIAAYRAGRSVDTDVINAAAAVELIHLASLIHDDIMDGGRSRWGVPAIHATEGIDAAILSGDYLLAKGCALAAAVSAQAGSILAETVAALCEGQALELNNRYNLKRNAKSLEQAVAGKTSSLFAAACVLGGLTAALPASQIKILSAFGSAFGAAYQYQDDLGDIGADISEGNYTLPVILSLQGSDSSKLKKLLSAKHPDTRRVITILKRDGSLSQAAKQAEVFKQQALDELNKLQSAELAGALTAFTAGLNHQYQSVAA